MRKMTEEQFDEIIAIHLKGTWNGTRAAASRMRAHGGGAIVNLSSISGKVGLVGQTNYSAAKAGIVRSEEHTSELQSRFDLVCRLLLEKKNNIQMWKYV